MLDTYTQDITTTTGTVIPFNVNALQKGNAVTHTAGSTTIALNCTGLYKVDFNATGTTTDAGTFGFQMLNGGTEVANAVATTTTTAGASASVALSALVYVKPSCACTSNKTAITFEYTGSAGTLASANAVIVKVG